MKLRTPSSIVAPVLLLSLLVALAGCPTPALPDDDDATGDDDDATGDDDDATGDDDDATGDDDDDATGDDDDDATPGGLCDMAIPVSCGDFLSGSTIGGTDTVSDWSTCSVTFAETGPEAVYRFDALSAENVTVDLEGTSTGEDLDLFVIDGCDPATATCTGVSTAAGGSETVDFEAMAGGSYYIVVDGYSGASDDFTLSITCGAAGDDDDDDSTGDDDDDATGDDDDSTGDDDDDATGDDDDDASAGGLCDAALPISCDDFLTGTTIGGTDTVSDWSTCSVSFAETGPEAVYRFEPGSSESVTVDLEGLTTGDDLDLFVIDGCDPSTATCSGAGTAAGGSESVDFEAMAGSTYYIVVDGFSSGEDDFTLSLSCGATGDDDDDDTGDDDDDSTGSEDWLPGDLVITEIFNNPDGDDGLREWFEITNTTGAAINLTGWTIRDDGTDAHTVTATTSTLVAPGAYFVIGGSTDPSVNDSTPVNYAYGSDMTLGNSSDEIVLVAPDGTIVDSVAYDNGATFPDESNISMSLDPAAEDATSNDDGGNWCLGLDAFGTAGGAGSPGVSNPSCGSSGDDDDATGDDDDDSTPVSCGGDIYDLGVGNESLEDAAVITLGSTLTDLTAGFGDDDWYRFWVDPGCTVSVEINFLDAAGDLDLFLTDGAGTTLASSRGVSDLETLTWTNDGASTTVAFVRVEYFGGSTADDCNAYTLTTTQDCTPPGSTVSAGDLVITEVMANPEEGDDGREWFEVFNATATAIDLNGFTVRDDDGDSFEITSSFVLLAGQFRVLGQEDDPTINGGAPVGYEYGESMGLTNSGDELELVASDGTVVDRVAWTSSWPVESGAAMSLDPGSLGASDNDVSSAWCASPAPLYGDAGRGTPGGPNYSCSAAPSDADGDGFTTAAGDCDDSDNSIFPGATEVCDAADNDCDGTIDEGYDVDGDGQTTCAGDCDDGNAAIYSGVAETCDGIDNDCDGVVDEGSDSDGDGYTWCGGDCNDGNAAINPGASDIPGNGVDEDCDGSDATAPPSCANPEVEPNGSLSLADTLTSGEVACGTIGTGGDEDYWRIVVTDWTQLNLDINAQSLGSPLDSVLELYNDAGELLAENDDADGRDSYLSTVLVAAGTYYVKVRAWSATAGGSSHTYQLVTQTPSACSTIEVESNDTQSLADFLEVPGTTCGFVDTFLDDDYFSFYAFAGETITFDVFSSDGGSTLASQIILQDSSGSELARDEAGAPLFFDDPSITYTFPSAGVYYLLVESDIWFLNDTGPYMVFVSSDG